MINPNIKIHLGKYVPTNIEEFDLSKNYLAFSGIGNHQSFIKMLKNYKIKIIKDIENNKLIKATLGGCVIEKVHQTVIIYKEY